MKVAARRVSDMDSGVICFEETAGKDRHVTEDELTDFAHRMAHARPDRSIGAARVRQPFRVARVWEEGARYIGVSVAIDDREFLASHCRPGQYTTFQFGEIEPRFLAIASPPTAEGTGEARWEFLIDRDSGVGRYLRDEGRLKVGRQILLSPAEGGGYPADGLEDKLAGSSVLLFSTGAGIASLRPVMKYWCDHPDKAPSNLALYYGESDLHNFAYREEVEDWRAHGVRVYRAVENLDEDAAAMLPTDRIAPGHRYVQHAFEADAPNLEGATVFVSGSPIMMEIVIAKMLRLGISPERIHVNI